MNSVKKFSKSFALVLFLAASFLSSCEDNSLNDSKVRKISVPALKIIEASALNCGSVLPEKSEILSLMDFLGVEIYTKGGTKVEAYSFKKEQLKSSIELEIGEISEATVVFKGYTKEDSNNPKWIGKATNVSFKNGETTELDVVMYGTSGAVCLTSRLNIPRFGHTVTNLGDGRAVVIGGFTQCNQNECLATNSIEIIDLESGGIILSSKELGEKRALHTAQLLSDGRILIVGGVQKMSLEKFSASNYPELPFSLTNSVSSVEIYIPPKRVSKDWTNKTGMTDDDLVETLDLKIKAAEYQSYIWNQNLKSIFMAGGYNQTDYGYIETASGISAYYAADETSGASAVSPLLISLGTTVFSIGGRASDAGENVSILEKSGSKVWDSNFPNTYFSLGVVDSSNNPVVWGNTIFDKSLIPDKNIYVFNVSDKSYTTKSAENPAIFGKILKLESKNQIAVIGGSQEISKPAAQNTLYLYNSSKVEQTSKITLQTKRMFSDAFFYDKYLVITGGAETLENGNSLNGVIEVISF